MSKTILLADDSVTIQKVIELTFMDQDCEVVAVSTGDDAVEKLGEMTPDLVIADVHMPGANGYEVARQSKQSHPGVPVLLLVGTFEPFDEEDMSASGADSHLKKPFDSQELLQLVERLMESAEAAAPETSPEEKPEAPPGPRPVPEPASAEPSPAPAEPVAPTEVPAPEAVGAETVRLDSLDLEREELRLGDEPEAASATPASDEAEEVTAEPAAGTAGRDVTWGNLDLEAVEEEEVSGSTEVEAPADATPLSEQDEEGGPVEGARRTEPFRLSEPDAEELTLEPEPAAEAPEPVAAQAVAAEPTPPEPAPPEPADSRPVPPAPPAEPPASAEPAETPAAPAASAASAATGLSDQDIERIARRVAELVGEQAVKDVAWEIVPDLAEVVIKDRIQQLESQAERAET